MALRFSQRLSRLLRADAHGIIESLEDRALLLKQHLREAELELQRKRARAATLDEEQRRLREDAQCVEAAIRALDADTRLALAGGREDLARFAIRKLLPKRREAALMRRRIDELEAERSRLAPKLASQEQQLEALRTRVREQLALEARALPGAEPGEDWRPAEEEVEMELLRRAQAAGGAE